jgi:hypothetical protein
MGNGHKTGKDTGFEAGDLDERRRKLGLLGLELERIRIERKGEEEEAAALKEYLSRPHAGGAPGYEDLEKKVEPSRNRKASHRKRCPNLLLCFARSPTHKPHTFNVMHHPAHTGPRARDPTPEF